jgi:hypothetical protein
MNLPIPKSHKYLSIFPSGSELDEALKLTCSPSLGSVGSIEKLTIGGLLIKISCEMSDLAPSLSHTDNLIILSPLSA